MRNVFFVVAWSVGAILTAYDMGVLVGTWRPKKDTPLWGAIVSILFMTYLWPFSWAIIGIRLWLGRRKKT